MTHARLFNAAKRAIPAIQILGTARHISASWRVPSPRGRRSAFRDCGQPCAGADHSGRRRRGCNHDGRCGQRHAPNGFFATEGGLEYPAVLGLAAAPFTIGGPGPFSLDSLTGHVLDCPGMRAAALAVIPAAIGIQIYSRRNALANDTVAPDSGSPVEED